ncbi:MAG TPA: hypothetical protein VG270_13490 [Pseudolabrys sp.]|jgi:hypothetical protein|nr:hypothetical protein [Pseudolabrys sp.]
MHKIVLSAVFALGMALAASTAASAAPLSTGLTNGATAAPNASIIQDVAMRCRRTTVCHRGRFGRRVCETRRVCRRW